MELNSLDLWFRRILLWLTIASGIVQYAWINNVWTNGIFIVLMAGIVGYYTNFLAIKMLFQPKQGKVLGWEGLVPKNKPKIAKSLGESIQNRLLAPEIILNYIYEKNLIEIGTRKISTWIDETLANEKVRHTISTKIISVIREKGPEALSSAFDISEDVLKKIAQNPDEIIKYWGIARERIIDYIKSEENREKIGFMLKKVMLEEMPKLSTALNAAIDGYLANKKTFGTSIGKSLKKLVSFDDEAIKDLLEKFVKDPETGEQFMGILDTLVVEIQTKLNAPETQNYIISQVGSWVNDLSSYARQNVLPAGIERLQEILNDEKYWKKLDEYSFRAMEWVKDKSLEFANSAEGQEYLKTYIGKFVHQINVTQLVEEQVMKLDTDDLEKMILDNTGGNLVVIQILGGVLGLIAGFIQVNVLFSIPVGALVAVIVFSYNRNRIKYQD
ncbi:MAG TPA: DUF445 family protein [Leptospiraceae bacterium]|nr:DUF445 family protein [Leptospiraceae bacterium]HMY66691.1 DUF445 family protein [Leptospiraceae bacterium]HNF13571.1 DUF445 family protein [Leptospiraceae bacterium]HNH08265.1 DUF445 family protein [Leptospiraceae bacterium]HNM01758.1 DUF445 family protein [Leptospiraceae bacterium]